MYLIKNQHLRLLRYHTEIKWKGEIAKPLLPKIKILLSLTPEDFLKLINLQLQLICTSELFKKLKLHNPLEKNCVEEVPEDLS